MNSYKMTLSLTDIDPGSNPRKDFGDIDALAATIEATGGQPVNPIIVVRDGHRFRIVDGERRYRALVKLHSKHSTTDVLVYNDYNEAPEAVAMLATDDKMRLSAEEQAQGFQTMMLLGVESRTIAKAMHRKTADIAAARAVAKEAPAQATIDQMIRAAQFDNEEDRAAVLAADPERYEQKAKAIEQGRKEEQQAKELYECIIGLGFDPEDEQPKGYRSLMWASTAEDMKRLVEKYDNNELAVWPCPWNKKMWYLGCKDEKPEETPEKRAARELRERQDAAYRSLKERLLYEVATCDVFPEMQEVAGKLRGELYSYTREATRDKLEEMGVLERIIEEHYTSPAAMWETLEAMMSNRFLWMTWVTTWLPPAVHDGSFTVTDEDRWLYHQAKAALKQKEEDDD